MDMDYFAKQIVEELEGAMDYAKRAVAIKPMNATWGKTFVAMSNAEIDHATKLYTMAQELYTITKGAYTEMPECVESAYRCATEKYTECSAKVKYILDMYNK